MPVAPTSHRWTRSWPRDTTSRPQTQTAIAAATSGPLGFTMLLTKKTIGVITVARPTARSFGAAARRSAVIAVAMSAPVIAAVMIRMR